MPELEVIGEAESERYLTELVIVALTGKPLLQPGNIWLDLRWKSLVLSAE